MSVDGVEIGVWYPSDASTMKQRLGPFDVDIARDAAILDGKHEIILFSHGNSGFYRNHYLTAQTLADAGFIVVAPQHEADYLIGGSKTAKALDHRYQELATALKVIFETPEIGDHANREKVHGLGYSLGGATILLASGAGYASERATQHCRKNGAVDTTFCEDPGWLFRLMQSFRHGVSLRNTTDPFRNLPLLTGKAILVAPVFQGIDPAPPLSISGLTVFAIEGDTIAIPQFHAHPLYEAFSRDIPSEYQIVPGHHFAFIAPFPKWLTEQEDIPVAMDPEGFDRPAFLKALNAEIVAAFADE
ncbi:MAG: hypothetical protein OXF95_07000 [Rhodobacteraceae bacterium]|nr:hypothetical protein [Paracoccaceae bacterium]